MKTYLQMLLQFDEIYSHQTSMVERETSYFLEYMGGYKIIILKRNKVHLLRI